MSKQEHWKTTYRRRDQRNRPGKGLKAKDFVSALRYLVVGLFHVILKLLDLNPVSLLLRRWRQTRRLDTMVTLRSRPRLRDLFTNWFLSYEGRKRKLLSWVHSVLPGHRDDVIDFGPCWQDGLVLCALMDALRPGSCGQYKALKSHHRVNNCRLGLQLAVVYLDISQTPLSPEEMSLAEEETETKLVHLVQMVMWRFLKKGSKVEVEAKVKADQNIPCRYQARGAGIKAGIVGRRTKFNIFADIVVDLELHIEIKGPNNEYNKEKIISVPTTATSKYRVHVMATIEDDSKTKLISDGAGHSFLRQKSLDEDLSHLIIPFDYQCVGEGRFLVTYIPRNVGVHYITILSKGRHVQGSPYEVKVSDWVSTWNAVPKPRVVPFDMLNAIEEVPKGETKAISPAIHKLRRKLSHVAIMSKQINMMKRRILKKVITQGGEEIVCEITPSPSLSGQSTPDLCKMDVPNVNKRHPLTSDTSSKQGDKQESPVIEKPAIQATTLTSPQCSPKAARVDANIKSTSPRTDFNRKSGGSQIRQPSLEKSSGVDVSSSTPRPGITLHDVHSLALEKLDALRAVRSRALTTDDIHAQSDRFPNGKRGGRTDSHLWYKKARLIKSCDIPYSYSKHTHSSSPDKSTSICPHIYQPGTNTLDSHLKISSEKSVVDTKKELCVLSFSETTAVLGVHYKEPQVTREMSCGEVDPSNSKTDSVLIPQRTNSDNISSESILKTADQQTVFSLSDETKTGLTSFAMQREYIDRNYKKQNITLEVGHDIETPFLPRSPLGERNFETGNQNGVGQDGEPDRPACFESKPTDYQASIESVVSISQDNKMDSHCKQCDEKLPSVCMCCVDSGNESFPPNGDFDEEQDPSPTICLDCSILHPDHFQSPDHLGQSPCHCLKSNHKRQEFDSVTFQGEVNDIVEPLARDPVTQKSSFRFCEDSGNKLEVKGLTGPTCSDVKHAKHIVMLSNAGQISNESGKTVSPKDPLDTSHNSRDSVKVRHQANVSSSTFYFRRLQSNRKSRSLDDVTVDIDGQYQNIAADKKTDSITKESNNKADSVTKEPNINYLCTNDLSRRRARLARLKKAWHSFDQDMLACLASEQGQIHNSSAELDSSGNDGDREKALLAHGGKENFLQVGSEKPDFIKWTCNNICPDDERKEHYAVTTETENEEEEDSLAPRSPSSFISESVTGSLMSSPVGCEFINFAGCSFCNNVICQCTNVRALNPSPSSFGTNKSGNSDWSDQDDPTDRATLLVIDPPRFSGSWSPQFIDYRHIPTNVHRPSSNSILVPAIYSHEHCERIRCDQVSNAEERTRRQSWEDETSNLTESSSMSGSLSGGDVSFRDSSHSDRKSELYEDINITNVEEMNKSVDEPINDNEFDNIKTEYKDNSSSLYASLTSQCSGSIIADNNRDTESLAEQFDGDCASFHLMPQACKFVAIGSHIQRNSPNTRRSDDKPLGESDKVAEHYSDSRFSVRETQSAFIADDGSNVKHSRDKNFWDKTTLHKPPCRHCCCSCCCCCCVSGRGGDDGSCCSTEATWDREGNEFFNPKETDAELGDDAIDGHAHLPNSLDFSFYDGGRTMSPFERVLTPTKFRRMNCSNHELSCKDCDKCESHSTTKMSNCLDSSINTNSIESSKDISYKCCSDECDNIDGANIERALTPTKYRSRKFKTLAKITGKNETSQTSSKHLSCANSACKIKTFQESEHKEDKNAAKHKCLIYSQAVDVACHSEDYQNSSQHLADGNNNCNTGHKFYHNSHIDNIQLFCKLLEMMNINHGSGSHNCRCHETLENNSSRACDNRYTVLQAFQSFLNTTNCCHQHNASSSQTTALNTMRYLRRRRPACCELKSPCEASQSCSFCHSCDADSCRLSSYFRTKSSTDSSAEDSPRIMKKSDFNRDETVCFAGHFDNPRQSYQSAHPNDVGDECQERYLASSQNTNSLEVLRGQKFSCAQDPGLRLIPQGSEADEQFHFDEKSKQIPSYEKSRENSVYENEHDLKTSLNNIRIRRKPSYIDVDNNDRCDNITTYENASDIQCTEEQRQNKNEQRRPQQQQHQHQYIAPDREGFVCDPTTTGVDSQPVVLPTREDNSDHPLRHLKPLQSQFHSLSLQSRQPSSEHQLNHNDLLHNPSGESNIKFRTTSATARKQSLTQAYSCSLSTMDTLDSGIDNI